MSLRCATGALVIATLFAAPACKKTAEPPDEHHDGPAAIEEHEPNDDREHCDPLPDNAALIGTLKPSDTDVVCPQGAKTLQVFAQPSVHVALEDRRQQRVELGAAHGSDTPMHVQLPGKDWVLILRGQGDWKVETNPEEDQQNDRFCGVQLGTEDQPVILGIQDLPAVFPLCAEDKAGAISVRFPSLVPSGIAGFELSVEGADAHTKGSLRVLNDGAERIRSVIEPGHRLPRLKWSAEDLISAEVLLAQPDAPRTLFMRVDPVASPDSLTEFLELEPNDTQDHAILIPRPGSVAGTLYHDEDVDWFRLDPTLGEVRIDALTQKDTRLRLQHVNGEEKADALLGDDGVYRLCSVGGAQDSGTHYLRVAYAPDAPTSDGVYQLTLTRDQSNLHPMTPLKEIQLPTEDVGSTFGFETLRAATDESPPVPKFGQAQNTQHQEANVRRGRLFPPEVEHGWVFQVPQSSDDYHVSIELHGKSSMDMKLRILDADGITVARADRGAAGQDERLDIELPTGYYVIAVHATGIRGCDGEYRLQIHSPNSERSNDAPQQERANDRAQNSNAVEGRSADDNDSDAPTSSERNARDTANEPSEEIPDYPW